jgi:predicted signal transduction protein with EAL and GGDEF domain
MAFEMKDMAPGGLGGWVLLALLGLGAAALLLWVLLGLGRAWRAVLAQARGLEQGRLVEVPEPPWPGLRTLARSLNATVRRLREVFAAQAEQVALLQRQAQLDAVSGLPLRQHFVGRLQHQLAEPGGPGLAVLIVRVLQLETLNPRLGHEVTDRLLGQIAELLQTYVQRVPGTFAGRLNGCDFALCLPVTGVARETAESLHATLAAAPALRSAGAEFVVGGADGLRDVDAGTALAAADAALARAEADHEGVHVGGVAVEQHAPGAEGSGGALSLAGATAWREQIAAALGQGRARLAEFEVLDADGRLVHLECPLRVQLVPEGAYHAADRWLALARRSRLLPQVDLAAVDLALAAIAADGRPRAVHAAIVSLATPGFVDAVARRLAASPSAAVLLSIECVEALRSSQDIARQLAPLAAAVAAWRPHGVRVGIEHAGGAPQQLPQLQATGIAYVKVDSRHLRGAAHDPAVAGYAQSLVALIHGLGLMALAEGVDDEADLMRLWALGFDGATGPALTTDAIDTSPGAL